jgi:hypothetical protein
VAGGLGEIGLDVPSALMAYPNPCGCGNCNVPSVIYGRDVLRCSFVRCSDFAISYRYRLDVHGANSSIATSLTVSPS